MAPRSPSGPNRRTFLRAVAAISLTANLAKPDKTSETVYRFLTPECEVRMSVQYFGTATKNLHFRDRLTNRAFCLSASGDENRNCLDHFSGSMAIAYYHFRSRLADSAPVSLREHVRTIDQDTRMAPRPPFERVLAVENEVASDIQAFGYDPQSTTEPAPIATPPTLWCLLRQDLYLDEQTAPFLTVHWKHTFDAIGLLDVIPGEQTQRLNK